MPLENLSTCHNIPYLNYRVPDLSEGTSFVEKCELWNLGLMGYHEAYQLQRRIHRQRVDGEISDTLLLLEHFPTFTIGSSGTFNNILASEKQLAQEGISLYLIERGGDVTYHGPGQLVGYPIMDLKKRGKDIRRLVRDLEEVMIRTLKDFSISASRDGNYPGVWVGKEEIAAIGLSIQRWVSMHGFALNVNPNLTHFSLINPGGFSDRKATSMAKILGHEISMEAVSERLVLHFSNVFHTRMEFRTVTALEELWMKGSLPPWFKQKIPDPTVMSSMQNLQEGLHLHTICGSAQCPNIGECFSRKTATFLILGDVCTRRCTFCAVSKGLPVPVDEWEPPHLLEAVKRLGLRYVVVTSVTRDDLADGGASQFVKTIEILHQQGNGVIVEVLVPDFRGSVEALGKVVEAGPEVINHNLETVPRLYPEVKSGAHYRRSLKLLSEVKRMDPKIMTKSGLMVGLGETRQEVIEVMRDLREANCDLLTIGQYLRPSLKHHPVFSFVSPEEFSEYEQIGREMGFRGVASAPLVRSSYRAAELYAKAKGEIWEDLSGSVGNL
jgi:lipoic acid synthetase